MALVNNNKNIPSVLNEEELSNENQYTNSSLKDTLKQKIMQTKSRNEYIKSQMENQKYYKNNMNIQKLKQISNVGELIEDEMEEAPDVQDNYHEYYASNLPPLIYTTSYINSENVNHMMKITNNKNKPKSNENDKGTYITSSSNKSNMTSEIKCSEVTLMESDQDETNNTSMNIKNTSKNNSNSKSISQNTIHDDNLGQNYSSFNSMEAHKDENDDEISIHPSDISSLSNTSQEEEKEEEKKKNYYIRENQNKNKEIVEGKEINSNLNPEVKSKVTMIQQNDPKSQTFNITSSLAIQQQQQQQQQLLLQQVQQKPPPSPVKSPLKQKSEVKENKLSKIRQFFSQSVSSSHYRKQNKDDVNTKENTHHAQDDNTNKENNEFDVITNDDKTNNIVEVNNKFNKNDQKELKEIIMSFDDDIEDTENKKENLSRIFNEKLQNSKDQDLEALVNTTDFNQLGVLSEEDKNSLKDSNLSFDLQNTESEVRENELPPQDEIINDNDDDRITDDQENKKIISPPTKNVNSNKPIEDSTIISYTMSEDEDSIEFNSIHNNHVTSPSRKNKTTNHESGCIGKNTQSTMEILYNSENQSIIEDVDKILSKNFNNKGVNLNDKKVPKNFINTGTFNDHSYYNHSINTIDATPSCMSSPRSYTSSEDVFLENNALPNYTTTTNNNNIINNYKEIYEYTEKEGNESEYTDINNNKNNNNNNGSSSSNNNEYINNDNNHDDEHVDNGIKDDDDAYLNNNEYMDNSKENNDEYMDNGDGSKNENNNEYMDDEDDDNNENNNEYMDDEDDDNNENNNEYMDDEDDDNNENNNEYMDDEDDDNNENDNDEYIDNNNINEYMNKDKEEESAYSQNISHLNNCNQQKVNIIQLQKKQSIAEQENEQNNKIMERELSNTSILVQSLPILIPTTKDVITNTIFSYEILNYNKHIDLLPSETTFIPVTPPETVDGESEITEMETVKQTQTLQSNIKEKSKMENESETKITMSIFDDSTTNKKLLSTLDTTNITISDKLNNKKKINNLVHSGYNHANTTTELSSPVNFTESIVAVGNGEESLYNDMDHSQLMHLQKNINDGNAGKAKLEHEIIQMSDKDKNRNQEDKDNSIMKENEIIHKTVNANEKDEQKQLDVSYSPVCSVSTKHNLESMGPLLNHDNSYLSELDEKQQQFILNNSKKLTEAFYMGMPHSRFEVKVDSSPNRYLSKIGQNKNDYSDGLKKHLDESLLSKKQIYQQIEEGLVGVNSEKGKIYQLTEELVQARNIINHLRDSLAFSDDEKLQLQKEFDCFQDKIEIERLNWKDEFKKVKEIQAQDYKEKMQLSNYIKDMKETLKSFQQDETKHKRIYQETLYQLQNSQENYNQLESEFNLLSKKYKELEQYLLSIKQSNEEIFHENKLLKDNNEELMQINDDLKKGNKNLIQLNKSLEEENKKIQESNNMYYKKESEKMNIKMQEVIQKNHEYVDQLKKMKTVQDMIENEYNELKSLLNKERSKNEQCESELTVFGRRIRTLVEQNDNLSKENDRIRNELRNLQLNPPVGKLDTQMDDKKVILLLPSYYSIIKDILYILAIK
ncbi:hypothetical protein BCR36DRAFT_68305 [Piromyces finnis]|uniref:Uncharacterized protein n=1 Tax=Piromyces finnis TaxID=1754191 RepID=A0A1Y1V815_9FUNG|nr:hypothetical protein BCR36DRAFT_68305 [Piromyces finnis]|eukprot:ORX49330.1 hypothetical protein BCR36DRAFT_68305 [Piromyces finnis]